MTLHIVTPSLFGMLVDDVFICESRAPKHHGNLRMDFYKNQDWGKSRNFKCISEDWKVRK